MAASDPAAQTADAAKASAPKAEGTLAKDEIVTFMVDRIKAITGCARVSRARTRQLLTDTETAIFAQAVKHGYLALPGGLGAFRVKDHQPRKQHTPQGAVIDVPARKRLGYRLGTKVKAMINGEIPAEIPAVDAVGDDDDAPQTPTTPAPIASADTTPAPTIS